MIGFARVADHYARHRDYQALLAACRAEGGGNTPALVMADWLDEWEGGPSHPAGAARSHAAFIRAQLEIGYTGTRARAVSGFGKDAPHCMKVWFEDTLNREPWHGAPATAVLNSTGTGVYYHGGLPAAVKCTAGDLVRFSHVLSLWRIPDVYVRVGRGDMGLAISLDERTGGRREELTWLRSPTNFRTDQWVNRDDIPKDRDPHAFAIETILTRTFAEECVGARFHAVFGRQWRSFHPY